VDVAGARGRSDANRLTMRERGSRHLRGWSRLAFGASQQRETYCGAHGAPRTQSTCRQPGDWRTPRACHPSRHASAAL